MSARHSRERVKLALSHQQPDRPPYGYVATPEINQSLMEYFKTDSMDDVFVELGIDLRYMDFEFIGRELQNFDDGRFENYWGHIRKPIRNEAGTYFESVEFPYAEFKSVKDVDKFPWPRMDDFDYSKIESFCDTNSDYAIVMGAPGNMDLINGTAYGRGFERVIMDIALGDEVGMACMDRRFDICYKRSERALQTANGKIDILWIGDDYGTQNGLLLSPETWRSIFYDKLKAMCDLGHKYGAKVMLHSCGSTRKIWPDLIEAGVDIYDTVQPEAVEMDPEELKAEFGDKICFHGSISTQKTLPFGTKDDVAAEVQKRIETLGKEGGFILAPAHNFQPDTPIENILAVYPGN